MWRQWNIRSAKKGSVFRALSSVASDGIENFVNDKRSRYAKHIKMLRILSGHRVTNVTYCNWSSSVVCRASSINNSAFFTSFKIEISL